MFVKCEAKLTLAENFAVALEVEKDLVSIGALEHESREDVKPSEKKNQSSSNKFIDKDKNSFDFEGLAKSLKQLNNEVSELKRRTSDASDGAKPAKSFFQKTNNLPLKVS